MTKPTFDQYQIADRRIVHTPTGVVMDFPQKQSWFSNGYSRCDVTVGRADMDLPNGERYTLREVMDTAWQLLATRKHRAA